MNDIINLIVNNGIGVVCVAYLMYFQFTTMKEIWQQIKLTNVHLVGEENSELHLSIYVDPLPSGVNSVWIFLAILRDN